MLRFVMFLILLLLLLNIALTGLNLSFVKLLKL